MGKIINGLLGRKIVPEDTKLGEVNAEYNMNDLIYPMQAFLNGIKDLTDLSGWDINSWSMKDINKFMDIAIKCGGKK